MRPRSHPSPSDTAQTPLIPLHSVGNVKVTCETDGETTYFIVSHLDPKFHETMRHQYFTEQDGTFRKGFPSDAPHLETCYQNFTRHIEAIILQLADVHPVPWEDALATVLAKTAGQNIDWWLGGSAAIAVRGVPIMPHDLDVITDRAGALALREVLRDALIEPVVECRDWICTLFGRAFLHATIDIAGEVVANVDDPEPTDFGPHAASRLETVIWRDHSIRVPPVDLQVKQNERRGLTERNRIIKQALG